MRDFYDNYTTSNRIMQVYGIKATKNILSRVRERVPPLLPCDLKRGYAIDRSRKGLDTVYRSHILIQLRSMFRQFSPCANDRRVASTRWQTRLR
jgi:hypothetical protein